ncbi:MAG TPA: 50S ribosomal protein L30 [Eubacteriales bacterium]|jgi:large subunit ribosomal protein L30|nr:50S ribosomal protein L30 [Clostridia bacterium]HRR89350.1 50S ribosomal protein L30 [Eubacteriales bacterium]HRU83848.1 50S ribosomal protein L30 [Eubacteriales bacterium]
MNLKITQVKSTIGSLKSHKANIAALGLGKVGTSVIREDSPALRGQLKKIAHLVKVEEV